MTTPCTRICTIDPDSGLCAGCGRSLTEIGNWPTYTETERQVIMNDLPRRLAGIGTMDRPRTGHAS